jgi:hypothetical protein
MVNRQSNDNPDMVSHNNQANAEGKTSNNKPPSILRSLTRLVVGGLLTGTGGVASRLQTWEEKVMPPQRTTPYDQPSDKPHEFSSEPPSYDEFNTNLEIAPSSNPSQQESTDILLRYAAIGLIFETQDRIGRSLRTAGRFIRMTNRVTSPFIRPLIVSRLLSPARNQFGLLVQRGEQEVQKWIAIGREEDPHSRDLADVALYDTVDFWIDYFAESPEVVDLVTSQSISFAEEVVEEVRERTVSADNFLESLVRTVFRRTPRTELPPPPLEVQREALRASKQARRL